MSCAVSVSKLAARIALPSFVFWTMYVKIAIRTIVIPKIKSC